MAFRSIYYKKYLQSYKNLISKVRNLNSNVTVQHFEADKSGIILQKINDINDWYCKLTGMDAVKIAQNRVIATQEKLEKTQNERREIGKLLVHVREKSIGVQEELEKTRRWEDTQKYLDLRREESEIVKSEKDLQQKFDVLDKSERDLFTTLCTAVRDSHEKERSQAEINKYWTFVFYVIGTLLGAVISYIYSYFRNRSLLYWITESFDSKLNEVEITRQNFNKLILQELMTFQNKQADVLNKLSKTCAGIMELNKNNTYLFKEIKQNVERFFERVGVQYTHVKENNDKFEQPELGYVKPLLIGLGVIIILRFFLG